MKSYTRFKRSIITGKLDLTGSQYLGQMPQNVTVSIADQLFYEGSSVLFFREISNFNNEINIELQTCTADQNGKCIIDIDISSISSGQINVTNLEIYFIEISNSSTNSTTNTTTNQIAVTGLNQMTSSDKNVLFELEFQNIGNETVSNINWSFDTGEGILVSKSLINLSPQQRMKVYVDYVYTNPGTYLVNGTVFNEEFSVSDTLSITINSTEEEVIMEEFNILQQDGNNVLFEMVILNNASVEKEIN